MRFLGNATIPVVVSLPVAPPAGSVAYYNNGFYGWNGTAWVSLNNDILTKTDVGLGNVDNTSDLSKPISTATQSALNGKAATGAITASGLTMSTATILGRTTASTGVVQELTGTNVTALLDVFSSSVKGVVPASGGGTTTFLRADGTWAAAGGGSSPISGTVTLDFGSTPAATANSTVTDGSITANSTVDVYIKANDSTINNDINAHSIAAASFQLMIAQNAGSFSVEAHPMFGLATGQFTVRYSIQ